MGITEKTVLVVVDFVVVVENYKVDVKVSVKKAIAW